MSDDGLQILEAMTDTHQMLGEQTISSNWKKENASPSAPQDFLHSSQRKVV